MSFWTDFTNYLLGPAYTGKAEKPTESAKNTHGQLDVEIHAAPAKPRTNHGQRKQHHKTSNNTQAKKPRNPAVKVGSASSSATIVTAEGRRYNNNSTRTHALRGPYNRAHIIKARALRSDGQ